MIIKLAPVALYKKRICQYYEVWSYEVWSVENASDLQAEGLRYPSLGRRPRYAAPIKHKRAVGMR